MHINMLAIKTYYKNKEHNYIYERIQTHILFLVICYLDYENYYRQAKNLKDLTLRTSQK